MSKWERHTYLSTFSSVFIKMRVREFALRLHLLWQIHFRPYRFSCQLSGKNKYLPAPPPVDWCPAGREWSQAPPLLDWSPGTAPSLSAAGWGSWRTATSPSHLSMQGSSPALPVKDNVLEQDHRNRAFSGGLKSGFVIIYWYLLIYLHLVQTNVSFYHLRDLPVLFLHIADSVKKGALCRTDLQVALLEEVVLKGEEATEIEPGLYLPGGDSRKLCLFRLGELYLWYWGVIRAKSHPLPCLYKRIFLCKLNPGKWYAHWILFTPMASTRPQLCFHL